MNDLKKQRKRLVIGLVSFTVIVLAVAAAGYYFLTPATEYVQGEVEVTEYRVSSKVPGRILKLWVEEGDTVHAGDTLCMLDIPDVEAKKEQATAAQQAAEALREKAYNGTRKETIQSAYEMWQKSKAGLAIAEKSYARVKKLFEEGVIAAQKLDEVTAQRDAAVATERAAHSQYQMALNGAQREDKEAALAQRNRAAGAVKEVNSYIREGLLTAQADGEISEVFPRVGELVGSGAPIMNVSEMSDLWITFNVREDLLSQFAKGQVLKARIPALDGREVNIRVYYLKDLGSYSAWKATKVTGDYDLKTFEVRARPDQPIEGLRPGMSVIVPRK